MRLSIPLLAAAMALPTPLVGSSLDPASSGGVVALYRALSRLDVHRRVLVIGAHPDDEDTSLLALVARGMGGEAAYLSLSRGEGGQNLIGAELGPELGLLRSEELLSARGVDGAHQYFTRAFDFGYTRSLDETLQRWPEEALLEDAVRVVRRFKPQVIVAVFPPDARAGHGQHQAAGVVAEKVFTLAGDPTYLPELRDEGLAPWQASIFYRSAFFRPVPGNLELQTGGTDPGSGKTYFQIAMASRSMHRSQDMGMMQDTGPRATRVVQIDGEEASGGSLFGDLSTRLDAIADLLPDAEAAAEVRERLDRAATRVAELRAELVPSRLDALAPGLAEVVGDLAAAQTRVDGLPPSDGRLAAAELLREKAGIAAEAWAVAAGFVVDATTDRDTLVPGREVTITATFYNSGSDAVRVLPRVAVPEGWREVALEEREVAPGSVEVWRGAVAVPAGAPASVPYFRARPRHGDLYDWSQADPAVRGEPFEPPLLSAHFDLRSSTAETSVEREIVYRYRDQAVGERRLPLRVVPPLEIAVTPRLLVWPQAAAAERRVRVTLSKNVAEEVAGRLSVRTPPDWPAVAPIDFRLEASRDSLALEVGLRRPERASETEETVSFEAQLADGTRVAAAFPQVSYPHIRPVSYPREAAVAVRSLELEVPALERVAYVRGASDRVPESLLEVGLPLEIVSGETLLDASPETLAAYDAIVIGSRAYETDPRLGEANQQLLDYARAGGLVLVQYQQYRFVQGGYAPFPLTIARPHDRITDETAPVELLSPSSPVLTRPHRIGPSDWDGWVQERGLYFAHEWDPSYQTVLRMTDPDQPPQDGGLLVAPVGRGTWVYTGLAFFRELPAGVPGAFRLFMNLLDLGAKG